MRQHRLIYELLACLLTVAPISALAKDVLTVRYLDARHGIHNSYEWQTIHIERWPPRRVSEQTRTEAVDMLFEQVSDTLEKHQIKADWQYAIPDAESIEITIEIKGHKIKLVSAHTLMSIRFPEGAPDIDFRRHAQAFEEILQLALSRVQTRFKPKASSNTNDH